VHFFEHLAMGFLVVCAAGGARADRPNLVLILADDLGYGDVHACNPEGKIPTPNMDRLAKEGVLFTDAHSGSAVCTPTRYGIVTGRYCWRSRLQNGVLGGLSPRLIEPGRTTVAEFLKGQGYRTACIGKWHLGMDWVKVEGKHVSELSIEKPDEVWSVDFTKPIANGPTTVGFEYYFGISASLDMVPYTFIENDRVTAVPSRDADFPMTGGIGGKRTRKGPAAEGFDAVDVLPTLQKKAVEYIGDRAADAKAGKPFFLYLPLSSPHTPIVPSVEWQGKSGLSPYADFVMQTDAAVGAVLGALDRCGIARDTVVVMTSDNGCSPSANFDELIARGHNPSYVFRGHKADIFDGGHRIPLIVRWPARARAGVTSGQLVCLTDFMGTCADILGAKLPEGAGEDSFSFLRELTGLGDGPKRESIVHHSINGSFAIREGKWKLELCPGSGGWSPPRPGKDDASQMPLVQLYDMTADVGERSNAQADHPEIVRRLTRQLEKLVADGRSTPGAQQKNTVDVDIWKAGKDAHAPIPARKGKKK